MREWFWMTLPSAAGVMLSTIGIVVAVVACYRLAGLRSFSKMSGYDFALTVATGSLIAATIATPDPPLVQGIVAVASVFLVQKLMSVARARFPAFEAVTDNEPLLLMIGTELLHDHLKEANITVDDVRAKLREANVIRPEQVYAVVLETTGDISVLHGTEDVDLAHLDVGLLENVSGVDLLRAQVSPAHSGLV